MKNILVLLIAFLFLTSCGSEKKQEQATETASIENKILLTEAQFKNAGIQLGKMEKRNISTTLKLNGTIDVPPQNLVSVSMPMGGYLKSTAMLPGMHVRKGEVIATMEDQQYIQLQQEYLTAKAKLSFAENEYNRQKELNSTKASSDKVFQQTEMDYKTDRIMVSALSEKLKLLNVNPEVLSESNLSRTVSVYSSIDGFVSKVNFNIGKYVNPSDVLFELINPDDIHLNLKVFEKDLNKLAIGQKLMAYTNNEPDKKHPCEIILISQDLADDRSAEIHCHFQDYDKTLFPGMYMNAEVELKNEKVISINSDAIVSFEGKDFVFVSKGKNEFEMMEITKSATEGNFTALVLNDDSNLASLPIVTHGAYSLLMQLKNKSEE